MTAKNINFDKFKEVTYESFRARALDESLSPNEKVGFPEEYRTGHEACIFSDILRKMSRLNLRRQTLIDIGPGCGELARMVVDHCRRHGHRLIQVDSPEMLSQQPDEPFIEKIPGRFPADGRGLLEAWGGKADGVLAYSILPCIYAESNVHDFMDAALSLLAEGGELLLGDIPNVSKRKRFFASPAGVSYHQSFMETAAPPEVAFNAIERGRMDDAVVLSLIARARAAGFDAYVMPQPAELPLANRREDVLIVRP